MYAIVKTGGKQYKVAEGDTIFVEKLEAGEGETVVFDQVLTVVNDASVKVGRPMVDGAKVTGKETNDRLEAAGLLPIKTAMPVGDLLRRQGVTYAHLAQVFSLAPLEKDVCEEVETMVRYEGYIQKQLDQVAHVERLEAKLLPESIDYADVPSLRDEAREKLAAIRPHSVGQASRISGASSNSRSRWIITRI